MFADANGCNLPAGTFPAVRPNRSRKISVKNDPPPSHPWKSFSSLMSVHSKSRPTHNLLRNSNNSYISHHEALSSSSRHLCIGRSGQCLFPIKGAHQPQYRNTNICSKVRYFVGHDGQCRRRCRNCRGRGNL